MNDTDLDRALAQNEAETRLQMAVEADKIANAEETMKDPTASRENHKAALTQWREATRKHEGLKQTITRG